MEASNVPLEEAVDELGNLWEEDEELHRFRRESVVAVGERLLESGDWESAYQNAFQEGVEYLSNEVDNPSRALLQAMRNNLVRSLFERVVLTCPELLRVRLVEQRRMIAPIAEIVSEPIYHGDYQTPPEEDLIEQGL